MSIIRTAAIVLVASALAAPSLAQNAPDGGVGNMSPVALWGNQLTAIAGAKASPDQWKRAVKAAHMINMNRCKDAYLFAAKEQDQRLAKRVYEVCTAPQP